MVLVSLLLTVNIFNIFLSVSIANFEQVINGWVNGRSYLLLTSYLFLSPHIL